MERNPHLLIEGCAIGCYAIGAKVAYIYIRGEFFHVQHVLERAIDEAYASGLPRQEHPRLRLRLRRLRASRRRRLRSGRGDGAARVARRQARAAAQQAAVPGASSASTASRPRSTTSRRCATCRSIVLERRGVVRGARPGEERRAEAVLRQRPREAARRVRSVDEHHAARADRRLRRRRPRRPHAEGGDPRRIVGADPDARSARHAGELRRDPEGRLAARLGGDHRARRHHLHGLARREPAALLPPRVVRQVHAVPRRHRLAATRSCSASSAAKGRCAISICSRASRATSPARRCARSATPR